MEYSLFPALIILTTFVGSQLSNQISSRTQFINNYQEAYMSGTNKFKYDVAISLCKEDVEFAKKLVKAINPNLNIFFYEGRQAELIGESGPEAFARVFKEESRVVVILSRNEWSTTFYTAIERNAIIDRIKNGFSFLMVMPMKQGEIPPWYPETHIYVRPFKFPIEQLAQFIEFKVADVGGIVKPLTLEEQHQNLIDRVEEKQNIINMQHSPAAIECAEKELPIFKNCFDEKSQRLKNKLLDQFSYYPFNYAIHQAHIGYGEYLLKCKLHLPGMIYDGIVTTQDVLVTFELSKIYGDMSSKKLIEDEQRVFYYTPEFQGWGVPHLNERVSKKELQVLFRNRYNSQYYDLINPLRTEILIDNWFQKLLSYSTETIERYI